MLKFGIISEILAAKGMARVKFDDDGIVSAPLNCAVPSSKDDQVQFPYNINQHVYCIMDDQCERGVVAGAVYDESNTPAGGDANIIRMKFKDGLEFKYDRSAKKLSVLGTGDVEINTTGKLDATVSDDANVTCKNAKVVASIQAEVQATTEIKLTAPITEVSGILKCASIQTTGPAGPGLHIDADGNMTTSGNFESTSEVKGATVKQGTVVLGTHVHSGVTTGGGTSGAPVP
jgi:phage baseplate assembly protein gpV